MSAIISVVHAAGPAIRFNESDISMRSLQSVRAMALLMARVDPDTIRLLGRWRSDTTLHYLQTTEKIFTEGLS